MGVTAMAEYGWDMTFYQAPASTDSDALDNEYYYAKAIESWR